MRGDSWWWFVQQTKSSSDMELYLLQPRSYNTSAGAGHPLSDIESDQPTIKIGLQAALERPEPGVRAVRTVNEGRHGYSTSRNSV